MPEVPDLSRAAANARAAEDPESAEEGAPAAPSTIPVHTAFIVFQTTDGSTLVTPDLNAPFVTMREPSRDEMYGMLATALKDTSATEVAGLSAETVIQRIEQKQQEALKAAQDAMIKRQLDQQGGIRG